MTAAGMTDAAEVLRTSTARVEEFFSDRFENDTTRWIIYLSVEPAAYAQLAPRRATLEDQISECLRSVLRQFTEDYYEVTITPKLSSKPDWRFAKGDVSRISRLDIISRLRTEKVAWSGSLSEIEFLQRLYDLESLPSTDPRFQDAAGDIWKHRIDHPTDWPDDWVYEDPRWNLLSSPSNAFLRFLCEMVHPLVRPDRTEVLRIVGKFNDVLRLDGWVLVEEEKIAGRPRFVAERLPAAGEHSIPRARAVAEALDAGWMQKELERLENSNAMEEDPSLAIGTAKELIETCCKTILQKRGVAFSTGADLPELTKLLTKELRLVPEGVSEEAKGSNTIRLILRNLASLTQYLAELRGLYGSGHGRDGKYQGLEPRHARLAVGAAVAFVDFVAATHRQRSAVK